MPAHQFFCQSFKHIVNGKLVLLTGHLRVEKNLQQQIAQLPCKFGKVAIINGLNYFIGLFDGVGLDGIEGLLAVPRTAARGAQLCHDGNGALKSLTGGRHALQSK